MAEGVVSRAFIMTNLASTPQATIRANASRLATIQKFNAVTQTEFISEIEQSVVQPSGAQEYQFTLVEPATTVSEVSLVRVKNAVRTISEAAKVITESLTRTVTHQLSESTGISENLAKLRIVSRTLSEPANAVGESLNKSAIKVRTINEPAVVIGESLTKSKQSNRTISESAIAVTEDLVKHATKVRQITEPPTNIQETLIHLKAAELTEAPIPITESLQASRTFTRSIVETVYVGGGTYTFPSASFTTTSFTMSLFDIENLVKKVTHNLAETTIITENLVKLRLAIRNLFETVPLQPETLQRLVTHYMNEPHVAVTESLVVRKTIKRTLPEPPTSIIESLTARRDFKRSINPSSFTDESFTTGAFESFNVPSGDIVEISEELEGFVLPYWQKVLIEPAIEITELLTASKQAVRTINESPITIGESLTTIKSTAPLPSAGGGGGRRRRRPSWMGPIPTLLQHRPITTPQEEEAEPERIPIITEIDINEPPIHITESLSAIKIITQLPTPITPPTPRVASIMAPLEPEPEPIPLLVVSSLLPLEQEREDPFFKQPAILEEEKEPEQRLEPIDISVVTPRKSRAAANLNTLQKLVVIAELEAMIS